MKRSILCVIFAIIFLNSNIFAQEEKDYRHWSLGLKGGLSRSEFSGGGILNNATYGYAFGAELERTFNPLWGLALEYEYIDYSCFDIDATAHEFVGLASVNLANLLDKYRKGAWQNLNVYGRLGAGISHYNAKIKSNTIVIPMGLALEYNVSRCLAIGVIGERRVHTSNSMGLGINFAEKAVIWNAMLNVRVKFGAKNHDHIRNVKVSDYEAEFIADAYRYNDYPLKKSLNNNAEEITQVKDQVSEIKTDVEKLSEDLDRTKEEIEKKNNEVKKDPLALAANGFRNVEFAVNSYEVLPAYHSELDILAEILKTQPSAKLQIIGHSDNTGNMEVNQFLSERRGEAVLNYLLKKGVDSKKMTVKGMGFSQPVSTNDTPEGRQQNRRAEFILSTK